MSNTTQAIEYLCNKWQLSNLRPFIAMPLMNNYAARAYSQHYKTDVVLKILLANTHETEALQLFAGNGCVKLLDYDLKFKGLLLEYINPGTSLKTLFPHDNDKAAAIAADVIKKLHGKNLLDKAGNFKTVEQWLTILHTFESKKIPASLLQKARSLSKILWDTTDKQALCVLHGDLHHDNILLGPHGWIAIDPKGVIGPLEYEVGRFIMNPIPDLLQQINARETVICSVDLFSATFGFEQKRLLQWTFVQAVLSACWTEEGGSAEFFNYFITFAEIVDSL